MKRVLFAVIVLMVSMSFLNAVSSDALLTLDWENARVEDVKALLEAGADPKVQDIEGKTALEYADNNVELLETEAYWRLNDQSR